MCPGTAFRSEPSNSHFFCGINSKLTSRSSPLMYSKPCDTIGAGHSGLWLYWNTAEKLHDPDIGTNGLRGLAFDFVTSA